MPRGEHNERSNQNQGIEECDAVSRTEEEECLEDAEAFNTMMAECGAAADNEEYFDDTSFDTQLENLDWASGEDLFETLPEMDIINHNIFD